MTTKSPTGRFGIFFGLKRRPSSNFQNNQDPLPPFYNGAAEDEDPFAAHYVPSPVETSPSPSRSLPQLASELEHGIVAPADSDPPPVKLRRPVPIDVFRSQVDGNHSVKTDEHLLRVSRNGGSASLGNTPLQLKHGGSATSVESLALAAAIAHANGMVLSPVPTTSSSHHRKSAATDEYPSPPPSDHSSPYPSGIPSNIPHFPEDTENEEEEGDQDILVVGSAGNSSLPTTPALIDSFPATPHRPLSPHGLPSQPNPPVDVIPSEALPIRTSRRGARQRAGSTPVAWSSANTSRFNVADLGDVWDVAETDERQRDYIYQYSLQALPVLGPPPLAPLPPEPLSPRVHSSTIYKHLHQLELDLTSLTRKLTPTSTRSTGSQPESSNPSTSDVPKMLKKSISYSRLQRESSGGTSGSPAMSSSQGASASPANITASTSQSKMEAALQNSKRSRGYQPNTSMPRLPSLEHRSSFGHKPSATATEPSFTSPLKLKDKDRKASKDKDHPKEDKDKDGFSKRRFFSKYASIGSHVEKEVTAEISTADLEDSYSITSIQSGVTGLPDDDWRATLGLAISSSLGTQESSINILPESSASSQKSPIEDLSPLGTPQIPLRSRISPTEYVSQHILPPAEILRLERTGFAAEDGTSSRGRNLSLGSPLSKSPPAASSSGARTEWERRSTSTSRADNAPLQSLRTRSKRSGSLAVVSSSSTTSNPGFASQSSYQETKSSRSRYGVLPRKYSDAPILSPSSKKAILRPTTTPSSPASVGAAMSLPPPPRPRIKGSQSSVDLFRASGVSNSMDAQSAGLPPPPRTSRRPSTASSAPSSMQLNAQKHHSILKKPSFLDIGDDDGTPSLEEVSELAAPALGGSDKPLLDYLITSSRSRSATISSNWTSSTLSTSRPTSRSTSRQPTPTLRDVVAAADDSFLDMGKLSLDTIRSEDEEMNTQIENPVIIPVPRPAPKPWHVKQATRPSIGSAF